MFMRLPSARYLKSLGRPTFESETALQRFFEKKLLREMGLRVVCSSHRGGGRLGNIDTIALDKRNRPVIIEYKTDLVDQAALDQLCRYREWLLDNRDEVARVVAGKWEGVIPDWRRLYLVSVGHRYDKDVRWPSFRGTRVRPLLYGHDDERGVLFLRKVITDARATYGKRRADRPSKAPAFRKHLTRTTDAGRRAFKALTLELRRRGFTRRFPGKNRVRYWKDDAPQAEVTLTPIGLQVLFRCNEPICDPEGRVGQSRKPSLNRTVGILSPADVPYAVNVLCREGDASPRSR